MIIRNGAVFAHGTAFENKTIEINKDRITALCEDSHEVQMYDATGCYVVPGFVDIHFHGCVGHDFCDMDLDGLIKMAEYELSKGITAICPATMTLPKEDLLNIFSTGRAYALWCRKQSASGKTSRATDLVGINLEGPFISHEKKGAQNPDYIAVPNIELIMELEKTAPGLLKLITIAPETGGALDFIKKMHEKINISLGHTTADYSTAKAAFDAGAKHVTHLFNAMSPLTHRDSGVIGAAFDAKDIFVELICDGVHLSDTVIRMAFQLFTDERIVLISDSMMATGMPDGRYSLGGLAVDVKGKLATLEDKTLAGSVTNLTDCFRHGVEIGIPLESALKAATINPAKAIGIAEDYGSIDVGKIANILILNKDLSIKDIFFHGKKL